MIPGLGEIEPALFVFLPILWLAIRSERWAYRFLVFSVPFMFLDLFVLVDHPFNVPKVAVVIVLLHQTARWLRSGEIQVWNARPRILLVLFWVTGVLSVLALVVSAPDVVVKPYGRGPQFVTTEPLRFTGENVTQSILRLLFVAVVVILPERITRRRLDFTVRGLVYGAIATGLIGVLYQIVQLVGHNLAALRAFGFRPGSIVRRNSGSLGPVPQMFSVSGEPGFTADFLLYGFAIAVTLALLAGPNRVMTQREATLSSAVLLVLLILTTSATGYGGLVILASLLAAGAVYYGGFKRRQILSIGAVIAMVSVIIMLSFEPVREILAIQFQKFQFKAGSGTIRRQYVPITLNAWLARPLFGIGFGSTAAPMSFPVLLAETGLVGITFYLLAHLELLTRPLRALRRVETDRTRNTGIALVVAGTTLFLVNAVAKATAVLIMPWYWFALALPIAYYQNTHLRKGEVSVRSTDTDTPKLDDPGKDPRTGSSSKGVSVDE